MAVNTERSWTADSLRLTGNGSRTALTAEETSPARQSRRDNVAPYLLSILTRIPVDLMMTQYC